MITKDNYLEKLAEIWRVPIEETEHEILVNGYSINKLLFWYMIEAHGPSQVRRILPKEVWE